MLIKKINPSTVIRLAVILSVLLLFYLLSGPILRKAGAFLVVDDVPVRSDAVVVLNTGVEYFPRLIEAAALYQKGLVDRVVINGNRKTDTLRDLESKGFEPCCNFCEDRLRVLSLFKVPRRKVICISAEDVYDTVSEAVFIGNKLVQKGYHSIIVTTSKYHTRRASHIWKKLFEGRLKVTAVSAKSDPFDPGSWWRSGRQVRWVMAEYGAWIYLWWKSIPGSDSAESNRRL
jgi:uncharacterized SAM-binding protein YcdF (DUF218 family)